MAHALPWFSAGMRDHPIRVLVASSDPVYAASMGELLASRGLAVQRFPMRAVDAGWPTPPAEVDVLLVEVPGLETAEWALVERLRRDAPLVEVVVVSANPVVEDAVLVLRSGAFAVLEPCVADEELVGTVRAAATRKRRAEVRIEQLNHDHPWERDEGCSHGPDTKEGG